MAGKVPQVVLMLGAHVPSVVKSVEKVLQVEKPVFLATENYALPEQQREVLADLYKKAEHIAADPKHEAQLEASLYLAAKRIGASYGFIEKSSPEYSGEVQRIWELASHNADLAAVHLQNGNVDGARESWVKAIKLVRQSGEIRERNIVKQAKTLAVNARKPVAILLGIAHAGIAKQLAKQGVKVVLYVARHETPFTRMLPGATFFKRTSKAQELRGLLNGYFHEYAAERYKLSDAEQEGFLGVVKIGQRLRRISTSEIEKMIKSAGGMTRVQFRSHFLNFLQAHGIALPSSEEMQQLKSKTLYPPFKKVKVFEPRQSEA